MSSKEKDRIGNRNILFMGKGIHSNGWLYGTPVFRGDKAYIITGAVDDLFRDEMKFNYAEVIPETVVQYIGIRDKNGTMIFENDIVKSINSADIMFVSWNTDNCSFCLERKGWAFSHYFGEAIDPDCVEIIGNIHDNRGLLEGT